MFFTSRELRHPNIVKFFGTNLEQSSCGTKVMVILELCKCSLKDRIMSHPENAPARSQDAAVRKNVLLWAMQILDALCYVHDQKFVHRDLKLDNLLVSRNLYFTSPLHEIFYLRSTNQIVRQTICEYNLLL